MNIADIIALAKQGYKPADIKELMSMAEPNTESVPEAIPDTKTEPVKVEPEVVPKEAPKTDEPTKDLGIYEQRIADLERKLKEAQQANIRSNMSDPNQKSDEDAFQDLVRGFM